MVCQSTDVRECFLGIDESRFIEINYTKSGLKKNKHVVKIGNVNVTTVKTDEKLVQSTMAVRDLGQELCVFSETHRLGFEKLENWSDRSELQGWRFIGTGNPKKAISGVGVVLSPDFEVLETEVVVESRILYLRMLYRGVRMQLFAVYAPTNMKSKTTKNDFFRKLQSSVTEKSLKHPNWPKLCIGDFNATIGKNAPLTKFIGPNLDTVPTTDMGQRMSQFMIENELYAMNTMFVTKKHRRTTWKLGKNQKRLDFFLADSFFKNSCKIREHTPMKLPFLKRTIL